MERADLEAHLASFPGAEASYPFGPDAQVYKVRGKMFALVDQGEPPSATLKCVPEDGELLVSQFAAVKPGYHMNKRHWLTISLSGDVPETLLRDLAGDSYALVVKGLPNAVRSELERSQMNVLFLQGGGAGAYDEDSKLAASLQRALGSGYTVHYPKMPDEDKPEYAAWKAKILEELSALPGDVILVGHSLGASFLLKVLTEMPLEPVGVFLLAPPFWGAPDWEVDAYALPEDFASSLPLDLPLVFYHSRDDDWVPFAHQARYAEKLPQATIRTFENRGHQFRDDLSEVAADIRVKADAPSG